MYHRHVTSDHTTSTFISSRHIPCVPLNPIPLRPSPCASSETRTHLSPDVILFVFLPILIFESAFNTDVHIFQREFWQVRRQLAGMDFLPPLPVDSFSGRKILETSPLQIFATYICSKSTTPADQEIRFRVLYRK